MVKRWRDSTATTIALTVVVAMVLEFSLQRLVSAGLTYLGLAPQETLHETNARLLMVVPGRVAAVINVLNAIPDTARANVVTAARDPHFHIRVLDAPVQGLVNRTDPDAEMLRQRIEDLLPVPLSIVITDRSPFAAQKGKLNETTKQRGVFIEAPLSDGRWLLFGGNLGPPLSSSRAANKFSWESLATWLLLSILLALMLSMLAARRLVTPLSELATAVDQLGGSGDTQPVQPRGPQELRETIKAFNRMQDRLRRYNDDRTRMIAAISHDLRTPLTRLRLRLEMVENVDEQQKMLDEIDKMSEMIESVLSFARDDTKHEARSLVDLSALVEGICQDAVDAGEPVAFSGPRSVTISCRPTSLRRAVTNLVDNAVKYGGKAAVSLDTEAERIVVKIEDEGPGIARVDREKVFEPFHKLDSSRSLNTGGVGLGLSVARSVVWEHGGEIILANRKGGGLTVRLELPVAPKPNSPACSS